MVNYTTTERRNKGCWRKKNGSFRIIMVYLEVIFLVKCWYWFTFKYQNTGLFLPIPKLLIFIIKLKHLTVFSYSLIALKIASTKKYM